MISETKIERWLNFVVGLILLNNVYYLTKNIGIPANLLIILCLVVCLLFFIKNFNENEFVNQANNWNTIFYVFISIPLCFIDWLINNSTPIFNDFLRVLLYSFYFNWTFHIYDFDSIKKWFLKISLVSFFLLTLEGIIENINPVLFTFLIDNGDINKRALLRIAGTLIDCNAYSGLLCILMFIIYDSNFGGKFKLTVNVVIFILSVYLTELSGSRQGLIMIIAFLIYVYFKKFSLQKVLNLMYLFLFITLISFIFWSKIESYVVENPSSTFSRFVDRNNVSQSATSDLERKNSINAGLEFCIDNYFVYGPGILNLATRYAGFTDSHLPHNGFLYILAQYGLILGLIPFVILFAVAKRAKQTKALFFFFLFLIPYSLIPNIMYYFTVYFAIFYIDCKYLYSNNKLN